ncbi:hypothetical protein [Oceanobacillus jeddahense]|nr:hypothetical protein [Oceanobacillus jeddahense]
MVTNKLIDGGIVVYQKLINQIMLWGDGSTAIAPFFISVKTLHN